MKLKLMSQNGDSPARSRLAPSRLRTLKGKLCEYRLVTDDDRYFIPAGTLQEILSQDAVLPVLSELLPTLSEDEVARYTSKICAKRQSFRRIFAILMLSGLEKNIVHCINLGLDDSYLPMPDPRRTERQSDHRLCDENSAVRIYDDDQRPWNRIFKQGTYQSCLFFDAQWIVLSPIFECIGGIKHFSFSDAHVLPFLGNNSDTTLPSGSFSRGDTTHGGHSMVRKVEIHPMHYRFENFRVDVSGNFFALKTLETDDECAVWQEINALRRLLHATHIIQLLASYEVAGKYHLIFPWATGNLEFFWELQQRLVGDYRVIPWVANQCYALAKELSKVHHDSTKDDSKDPYRLYGRHGDVKPSNCLWFTPLLPTETCENLGELVLADFGLADFRSEMSRSRVDPQDVPRCSKYRAPEFDIENGKISRKVDIWMLGCTFLEFATWYLLGIDAVKNGFCEARSEEDVYGIYADTFFRIHQGTAMIKPQVTDWISRLHKHEVCNEYMHDFLQVIEHHMLTAHPIDRRTASRLSQKLDEMRQRCHNDVQYYRVARPWSDATRLQKTREWRALGLDNGTMSRYHRKRMGEMIRKVWNALRPRAGPSYNGV